MENLLIIDGHNLLFRMFYGIPSPIMSTAGIDIRGVIGFIGGMLKAINLFDYDNIIIIFDSETSSNQRKEIDKDYKNNRIDYSKVEEEANPFTQLSSIYTILDKMGIEHIEIKDHEADDYIASLCNHYSNTNIVIYSTDRDFLQLVNNRITLYCPRGKNSIKFDPAKTFEKFNIYPDKIIDYKVLVGDVSDNIKGVRSIGPKTAVKILNNGTLSDIILKKIKIEPKLSNKILEDKELIQRNINLIRMKTNIKIEIDSPNFFIKFDKQIKTKEILKYIGLYY